MTETTLKRVQYSTENRVVAITEELSIILGDNNGEYNGEYIVTAAVLWKVGHRPVSRYTISPAPPILPVSGLLWIGPH